MPSAVTRCSRRPAGFIRAALKNWCAKFDNTLIRARLRPKPAASPLWMRRSPCGIHLLRGVAGAVYGG